MSAVQGPDGGRHRGMRVGKTHFTSVPTRPTLTDMKNAPSNRELIARGVRPDSRKRVALGRALANLEDASFNVYRDEDGRIILDPQVSVPASEAWLFRNRKALDSVRRGLEEVADGKARPARSFARFADDSE